MIKNNIKYIMLSVVVFSIVIASGQQYVTAESLNGIKAPIPEPLVESTGNNAIIIKQVQIQEQKIIASITPDALKQLGQNYKLLNSMQYETVDGVNIQHSFESSNGKYTVTITLRNGEIIDIDKYERHQWGSATGKGFAIDQYDGIYTLSGLGMVADIPSYDHTNGAWTTILTNAQKSGSTGDVCISSNAPKTYWGQIGMEFSSSGVSIGFTDTLLGCYPYFFPIPFNVGDTLKYRIFIDDDTDTWNLWVDNLSDVGPAYQFSRVVSESSTLDTNTKHTSVWFENPNGNSVDWDEGFTADPKVDYASFQWTNNNWYYWDAEKQTAYDCVGDATELELMSGTFVGSPHDVTFDVSNIDSKCGA